MSLPVAEATSLVRSVIAEIGTRAPTGDSARLRLMITGSEQDDDGFCRVVEECGGKVVTDFLCPGIRG